MNKHTKPKSKPSKTENIQKSVECKNIHSSPMSNLSWCVLNNEGNLVRIHDMCPNLKCKCQKQFTLNANQFQIEGSGLKKNKEKNI